MIWLDKSNILFDIYQEIGGDNTEKLPNIFVKSFIVDTRYGNMLIHWDSTKASK